MVAETWIEKHKTEIALRNKIFLAKPQDLLRCSDAELNTWIALIHTTRKANASR